MLGRLEPALHWWRGRRLRIHDLPRTTRVLVWVSLALAAVSALLIIAVGAGWEPWGGRQFAAYGGRPPRVLVPWALATIGILAFAIARSTTTPGWRHPVPVRVAVAVGGAALAAQGISMGWVIDGAGGSARLVVPLGWVALAAAAALAVVPQRMAERHPWRIASLAATPFAVGLLVWASIGGRALLLPDGVLLPARDAYAQATITFVGTLAAAAGILLLWSLVLSTRQARDIGEGMADVQKRVPTVLTALLVAKVIWLVMAYTGTGLEATVESSTADGWVAWIIGALLVAAAVWWLAGRGAPPPTDYENREALRTIGFGYAGGPIAAVAVALVAAIAAVLWTLEPGARLNDLLGWLIGSDPPVALWVVVGVSAITLVGAVILWWRGARSAAWIAAAVVGVWAAPRAIELTTRILGTPEPIDAPSLVTIDTLVTAAVVVGVAWRRSGAGVNTEILTLVLVVSTLIAHPLGIMPAGWQDGSPFYLLLVYPLAYTYLFDSVWLNELDEVIRPGRVLRTVSIAALLVVTTSMLVLLDRVGPGFETAEAALLGAIGQAYLLYPSALLAVASTILRRNTGDDEGSLGTAATRRWVWQSVAERVPRTTKGKRP